MVIIKSVTGVEYQKDIASGLLDLFDDVEDVGAFFFEHAVHGGVVGHYDVVVHVGFRGGDTELDETDLGFFDAFGAVDVGDSLGENEAGDELRVFDGAPQLLDYFDV